MDYVDIKVEQTLQTLLNYLNRDVTIITDNDIYYGEVMDYDEQYLYLQSSRSCFVMSIALTTIETVKGFAEVNGSV